MEEIGEPVEVGSLSHYIPVGAEFLPSTVAHNLHPLTQVASMVEQQDENMDARNSKILCAQMVGPNVAATKNIVNSTRKLDTQENHEKLRNLQPENRIAPP